MSKFVEKQRPLCYNFESEDENHINGDELSDLSDEELSYKHVRSPNNTFENPSYNSNKASASSTSNYNNTSYRGSDRPYQNFSINKRFENGVGNYSYNNATNHQNIRWKSASYHENSQGKSDNNEGSTYGKYGNFKILSRGNRGDENTVNIARNRKEGDNVGDNNGGEQSVLGDHLSATVLVDETNALTLDEITHDRNIKWINVSNEKRPKPSLALPTAFLKQVQTITSSNQNELEKLDNHYIELDRRKKICDKKFNVDRSGNETHRRNGERHNSYDKKGARRNKNKGDQTCFIKTVDDRVHSAYVSNVDSYVKTGANCVNDHYLNAVDHTNYLFNHFDNGDDSKLVSCDIINPLNSNSLSVSNTSIFINERSAERVSESACVESKDKVIDGTKEVVFSSRSTSECNSMNSKTKLNPNAIEFRPMTNYGIH